MSTSPKPFRFAGITESGPPVPQPDCLKRDDMIRRVAGSTEIKYINGVMLLSRRGTLRLALAVLKGEISGDAGAARRLMARPPEGGVP